MRLPVVLPYGFSPRPEGRRHGPVFRRMRRPRSVPNVDDMKNITARAGGGSARHRWWALAIWIAFVAAAVFIGRAVETVEMKSYEDENGDSRQAEQIIYDGHFKE